MPKYFTAIIVCDAPGGREQFLKYRNIPQSKEKKLMKFAASRPGVHHVNLYDRDTKKFVKQIKKQELQEVGQC